MHQMNEKAFRGLTCSLDKRSSGKADVTDLQYHPLPCYRVVSKYDVAAPFSRHGGRGTRCAFSKSLAARGNRAAISSESMSFAAPSKTLSEFEPRRPSVPDFRFLEVVRCSGSILAHRVYIFAGKRGLKILQLRKVLMN